MTQITNRQPTPPHNSAFQNKEIIEYLRRIDGKSDPSEYIEYLIESLNSLNCYQISLSKMLIGFLMVELKLGQGLKK